MTAIATVRINDIDYASFAALGEKNANVLKRLVEQGLVKKVAVGHCTYFEVTSARRELDEFRTVPPGYVRVSDVAEELGMAAATAREIVRERGVPYAIRSTDNKKGSYFAEEKALRAALAKPEPEPEPLPPPPVAPGELGRMEKALELGRDPAVRAEIDANRNVRTARQLILNRLAKAPAYFGDLVTEGGLSVTMGARTSGEVARDELLAEGKVIRLADGKLGIAIVRRRPEPPPPALVAQPDELEEAAVKESVAFAQMRASVLKTREQVRSLEKRVAELETALGRQGTAD